MNEKSLNIIRSFILDKYKYLKSAAKSLDISPPMLSMMLKGKRKIPSEIRNRLIAHGLDRSVFYELYGIEIEENLEDYKNVVTYLQDIILSQRTIIDKLENILTYEKWQKEKIKKELHATRMELLKDRGTLPKKFSK